MRCYIPIGSNSTRPNSLSIGLFALCLYTVLVFLVDCLWQTSEEEDDEDVEEGDSDDSSDSDTGEQRRSTSKKKKRKGPAGGAPSSARQVNWH